jgi:small redox-active disulfide protein 2
MTPVLGATDIDALLAGGSGTPLFVEFYSSTCPNCRRMEANAREAVSKSGVEAEVTHVTDPVEIVSRGVMSTPGLVIDGKVVSTGRIPSATDIVAWLAES